MTDDEAKQLRILAVFVASKMVPFDDIDDMAQEVVLRHLESPRKQLVRYTIIDILRERDGRRGRPSQPARRAVNGPVCIHDFPRNDPRLAQSSESLEFSGDFERLVSLVDDSLRRAILTEYFLNGRTLKEIGALMGFTESRICQIMRVAIGEIRNAR